MENYSSIKIAIIDKCPSNTKYKNYFKFDFDVYHLASEKLTKVLRKDVNIDIDVDSYNYIITIGSEATKYFAKVTSVTDYAGFLLEEKFIPMLNPAMLAFKPEVKASFDKALDKVHRIISGESLVNNVGDFRGIRSEIEALDYLDLVDEYAKEHGVITLDTETTALYPRDGYVLGVSISGKPRTGAYIDSDCITQAIVDKLQYLIDKYLIVFHNAKFDIKMLKYHFNLKFKNYGDTLIIHYLLDETQGSHGLKQLALKYTDYGDYDSDLEEFKVKYCREHGILKEDFTYDLIPFDIIYLYAAKDTAVTYDLYLKFFPLLEKNKKLYSVYSSIMIPANSVLLEIEDFGVPIDKTRLLFAKKTIDETLEKAENKLHSFKEVQEIEEAQHSKFNPNSVMQLRTLLFNKLKLDPIEKFTTTGAQSTDSEVLESLVGQHPIVDAILNIRKLNKVKNTYIDKLLPSIDLDGFVRTGFNLTTTTSGRLSSSGKFNAQQLIRDEYRIKGAIKGTGKYKDWLIVSQDLATAEMYYAAVLSDDKALQKVFINKEDFHSSIAKQVFDLPCKVEEVKSIYKDLRQAAKAISFGILYGSGPQKVSDTVSKEGSYFSLQDAREAIDLYFGTFKKLKAWLKSTKETIESQGFIYTSFGRKRRLENVFSPDKGIASHEVRSGINATIQSLASDINLLAAVDTFNEINKLGIRANIFMLVHDSITAIVHPEDVKIYCEILAKNTQKDRGFSIPNCPIGIDQEIGEDYSFGKFKEKWGERFDEFLNETGQDSISSI